MPHRLTACGALRPLPPLLLPLLPLLGLLAYLWKLTSMPRQPICGRSGAAAEGSGGAAVRVKPAGSARSLVLADTLSVRSQPACPAQTQHTARCVMHVHKHAPGRTAGSPTTALAR